MAQGLSRKCSRLHQPGQQQELDGGAGEGGCEAHPDVEDDPGDGCSLF